MSAVTTAPRDAAFVCVCAGAMLLPFAGKAIHIDDPLFVWTARHILDSPLEPYGFLVNWYGIPMPMSDVAMNPPLFSYLLALAGLIGGWSEVVLHLVMLPIAMAVLLGTMRLARERCADARLAALLLLATPAFLVSATTLMCDLAMLALWVWSLVAWESGLRDGRPRDFAVALLLAVLATGTKYFGLALLPLFLLHAVASGSQHRARACASLALLAAPVLALVLSGASAGISHITGAMHYALDRNALSAERMTASAVDGLGFLGAGTLAIVPVVLALRRVGPQRSLGLLGLVGVLAWLLVRDGGTRGFVLQQGVHVGAGIAVLAALPLLLRGRDGRLDFLLPAWIIGTLVFACWVNWTVNMRAILPLAPAWSILAARMLEDASKAPVPGLQAMVLLPMLGLSLWVSVADYRLAATARDAARELSVRHGEGHRLWYQGHWGAQYYLDRSGAEALDFSSSELRRGDRVVVPLNNTNLQQLPASHVRAIEVAEYDVGILATMSTEARAGLYASVWGPLPYVAGGVPPERYVTLEVTRDFRLGAGKAQ